MIIEETNVPDISIKNIKKSKVDLANDVISMSYPLLNKEYISELKIVRELNKKVKEEKEKVLSYKKIIQEKYIELKKKKKEQVLLDRVRKLVSSGILSKDITLKNEMVVLLKIIDTLPSNKLDLYLNETLNIISKRSMK